MVRVIIVQPVRNDHIRRIFANVGDQPLARGKIGHERAVSHIPNVVPYAKILRYRGRFLRPPGDRLLRRHNMVPAAAVRQAQKADFPALLNIFMCKPSAAEFVIVLMRADSQQFHIQHLRIFLFLYLT